jgi:hypothetical protein
VSNELIINYAKIKDDKYETEIEINYYSSNRFGISMYYEHDKDKNRYYMLDDSNNLHDKNMDGVLVKRRISKKCFEEILETAKKHLK